MQVTTDAVMWKRNINVNVMTVYSTGSAFPVGADAFLLTTPRPRAAAAASSDLFALPPPTLGRSNYATLRPHAELHSGKLLSGTWRDIARQFTPSLHPAAKPPLPGRGSGGADAAPSMMEGFLQARAALLLTGPERGGKTMEVEAAAAAMGLQVVEVDCRSLSSSSPMDEAECIMHLQNVIRSVRPLRRWQTPHLAHVSPCIRLLNHTHVSVAMVSISAHVIISRLILFICPTAGRGARTGLHDALIGLSCTVMSEVSGVSGDPWPQAIPPRPACQSMC